MARKILVVDDDQAMRSGLKKLLEEANFEVTAVGTYAEGRVALRQFQPDLLITDVRLGEFNGLQLVASTSRAIPAVVLTGFPDAVIENDARNLGAEYLVKPVSADTLMTIVRQNLEPRAPGSAQRPVRRWARKRVTRDLRASINDRTARVLDISYGGLRLEFEPVAERPLPSSFTVNFPSCGLSVPIDVVWTTREGETRWVCGGTITQAEAVASRAWHGFVDAIA